MFRPQRETASVTSAPSRKGSPRATRPPGSRGTARRRALAMLRRNSMRPGSTGSRPTRMRPDAAPWTRRRPRGAADASGVAGQMKAPEQGSERCSAVAGLASPPRRAGRCRLRKESRRGSRKASPSRPRDSFNTGSGSPWCLLSVEDVVRIGPHVLRGERRPGVIGASSWWARRPLPGSRRWRGPWVHPRGRVRRETAWARNWLPHDVAVHEQQPPDACAAEPFLNHSPPGPPQPTISTVLRRRASWPSGPSGAKRVCLAKRSSITGARGPRSRPAPRGRRPRSPSRA